MTWLAISRSEMQYAQIQSELRVLILQARLELGLKEYICDHIGILHCLPTNHIPRELIMPTYEGNEQSNKQIHTARLKSADAVWI